MLTLGHQPGRRTYRIADTIGARAFERFTRAARIDRNRNARRGRTVFAFAWESDQ